MSDAWQAGEKLCGCRICREDGNCSRALAITAAPEAKERECDRLRESELTQLKSENERLKKWPVDLRSCGEMSCDECNERTAVLRAENEELRKARNIMATLVERALCGCFSLDCVKHGSYCVDEIALYEQVKAAELLNRKI